jgi:hypothetical protein
LGREEEWKKERGSKIEEKRTGLRGSKIDGKKERKKEKGRKERKKAV